MRHAAIGALSAWAACVLPARLFAQDAGGVSAQECCVSMLLPYGARAVSLGQALTARASADALFFNPAGLAGLPADQFLIHHARTFEGQNNVFTLLLQSRVIGTIGLTFLLVDLGETEITTGGGQTTGSLAIRHQALVASFATPMVGGLRAGVNYKLYNEQTERSATTHMIDVGAQYTVDQLGGLELGAAITHLGFKLQVVNAEQADQTPARVRLGAAYELGKHFLSDSSVTLWLSADALSRLLPLDDDDATGAGGAARSKGLSFAGNVGVEVGFDETLFVRAGYASTGDGLVRGGTGIGVGINYDRFQVAVAKGFSQSALDTGDPFQITFRVGF